MNNNKFFVKSLYNISDKYDDATRCPVCNNIMSVQSWHESMGTVEENHKCPKCGYYYEFAYGNYMEIVNRREFIWSYTSYDDKDNFKKFTNIIKRHIKLHKLKWKLYRASYLHKEPYFTYLFSNLNDKKIERIRGGI